MAERGGKKVEAKRGAEKSGEKVISSFIVISIVLSVLAASVATVSALNGGIPSPPPPSNVTEIVVTASPESIPADGSSTSTITATVTDWEDKTNKTDPSGFGICFTIISQPGGARLDSKDSICNYTDEKGNASTTLTAGTIPGEVVVKAYAMSNESAFDYVTITLTSLPREGSITGKIIYSNNETGIAGVIVNLTREGVVINTTTTNETGYYNFIDVDPGNYSVEASKRGFWGNSTEVEVIAGETTEVNMILWLKGDLNNNGMSADAGDLVLMKRASVGEISGDWKYDLNNNDMIADAGDLVLMKRASVGEIVLI